MGTPSQRRRKIEAETVEAAVDHPPLHCADRHVDDQGPIERDTISGAGVVDVSRRIAGVEAEKRGVVEPAKRQRRSELIALAIVVEDDVEDRLDASGMQGVGRCAHLSPAAGRKARIRDAENHRIVAPGVREAERGQVPLVDEGVRRHDFNRGDAEGGEMVDRSRMRQSGESSARAVRDRRVQARKAAQVEFVYDERFRRHPPTPRLAGRRRAGDGLGRIRAAVDAERKHRGAKAERPVERPGVGVGQQFGGVEASASPRIVGTLDTEAIARAGPKTRGNAAKDARRVARHRRPEDLLLAVVKAERRAFGIGQVQRGLEAVRRNGDAQTGDRLFHWPAPATERNSAAYRRAGPRHETSARIPLSLRRRIVAVS